MRLAVFSDIHGNLTAFEAMLSDMQQSGDFDQIWCLGDIAALGGQPHECIQKVIELREHYGKDKFKVIGGNTDRYLVTGERFPMPAIKEEAEFDAFRNNLNSMAAIYKWNLEQLTWEDYEMLSKILHRELCHDEKGYGNVIGFHAIPGDDESMALRPDTDDEEANDALLDRAGRLALGGHTHLAMNRSIGAWTVINPGSVGMSFANQGQAEWAILTWIDNELAVDLRSVPYDVQETLNQWEAKAYPDLDWASSRLMDSN